MILVNGIETDSLPVSDRGLQYGDGLFETLAIRGGRPLSWPRHMARLLTGCERLGIPAPPEALLIAETNRLISEQDRAVLKIVLTRGGGPRGYRPPERATPTRIFMRFPDGEEGGDAAVKGISVTLCRTRIGRNPALAGLKHLNRLEQVLARAEWGDEHAEGLMLDEAGNLVEGTMSNVFLIHDNVLHTPDLAHCGVAGVMRAAVLDAADALGFPVKVREIAGLEIEQADGLFLCNALIGLWPVRMLGARRCTIHPLVGRLRERLALMGELP